MNVINKIHYAVEISLINNGQDNSNIGMSGGAIRYVSDGLDMSSGFIYEDESPVVETFFSDIVKKDGFSKMGSKIDIATGGDYAYLQSFSLTLPNKTLGGQAYHVELDDEETYVIGGVVKVYVVIDGILYSRWHGRVAGVSFNDRNFTWNCEDSHSADNNTINNKAFGLIKNLPLVISVDDNVTPDKTVTINRVRLDKHDDRYDRVPPSDNSEAKIPYHTPMAEENQGVEASKGVEYSYTKIKPVNDGGKFDGRADGEYRYDYYTAQSNSNFFQIWLDYDELINMEDMVYIGISLDGGEAVKYLIKKYDIADDIYGGDPENPNYDPRVYRLLIKDFPPINQLDDQFGSFESLLSGTVHYNALSTFNGATAQLYSTGVKVADGIVIDNIEKIVDVDGNEISTDVITKIGNNYYLPFNIITYSVNPINNRDIAIKYQETNVIVDPESGELLANLNAGSYDEYRGLIQPTAQKPCSSLAIDTSKISLDTSKYDSVFLGVNVLKVQKSAKYRGNVEGYLDFGYDGRFQFIFGWPAQTEGLPHEHYPEDEGRYKELVHWTDASGGFEEVQDSGGEPPVIGSSRNASKSWANQMNFDIVPVFKTEKYGLVYNSGGAFVEMGVPLAQHIGEVVLQNSGGFEAESHIEVTQISSTNLPENSRSQSGYYDTTLAVNGLGLAYFAETKFKGYNNQRDTAQVQELDIFESIDKTDKDSAPDITELLNSNKELIVNVFGEQKRGIDIETFDRRGEVIGGTINFDARDLLAVPAFVDFSLVGKNENTADELYGIYKDDDELTGTDTIGKVLSFLTGDNSLDIINIRESYFVGRYITDQVNKYSIITELCKTSFIGGYTNRFGKTVFKRLLEFDNDNSVLDNNDIIIKKSIKPFKHTPISKVYNEFEVKYCYVDGKPEKTLEIHNVDKDEFPDQTDFLRVLDNYQLRCSFSRNSEGDAWGLDPFQVTYSVGEFPDDINDGDVISTNLDIDYNEFGIIFTLLGEFKGYVSDVDIDSRTITFDSSIEQGDFSVGSSGTSTSQVFFEHPSLYKNNGADAEWSKWVVGVNDYLSAKEFWLKAREGYLRTGVIQKAPANRTDLKWAVETDWLNNTSIGDPLSEYGYDFFNKLVDWSIFQKLRVSYSLPITPDTIIRELLGDVRFNDPIITPSGTRTDFIKGWYEKYEVDPKKDIINVAVIFEPNDINPAVQSPVIERNGSFPFTMDNFNFTGCVDIIENENNLDTIAEDENNTDTITEVKCPE